MVRGVTMALLLLVLVCIGCGGGGGGSAGASAALPAALESVTFEGSIAGSTDGLALQSGGGMPSFLNLFPVAYAERPAFTDLAFNDLSSLCALRLERDLTVEAQQQGRRIGAPVAVDQNGKFRLRVARDG
ncbi:hypothetical protein JYT83_00725, partial [bacterium AH-315-F18]|nr:hypothetical protein [bacterium AH-315-F18]